MRAQELLGKYVSVRDKPSIYGVKIGLSLPPYSVIAYVTITNDIDLGKKDNPDYMWFMLGTGRYVAYTYPPNGQRFELIPDVPPAPLPVGDPLVRPTVVPKGKTVALVLMNWERPPLHVSRPTMNGNTNPLTKSLPDTAPFFFSLSALLDRTPQECWFALVDRAAPESMTLNDKKRAWASLTYDGRAFTNGAGSATRADYINGTNLDAGPMRFITMATGGAILDIVGGPVLKAGTQCYIVRTVDIKKLILDPYTVFWATISCRDGINLWTRKWTYEKIERPFPQLGGLSVPVPIFSVSDTGLIPCSRVRVLTEGMIIPSPYLDKEL